jgi:hypothetical protein
MLRTPAAIVFTLIFAACGAGGGSSAVTPPAGGSGGGGGGALPSSVTVSAGAITGLDNAFTPNDGDSSTGGNGQTVDGIPCLTTMSEAAYHVHVFLGFVNNGQLVALPDGTGMKNPGADSGGVVSTATCFYYLHTHDASGVIHLESPSTASRTTSLFTLGTYLDIWGHSLGSARVYTSGQHYEGQGSQTVANTAYTQYTGDPRGIALYAHEVIWVENGPNYVAPSALPSVTFTY